MPPCSSGMNLLSADCSSGLLNGLLRRSRQRPTCKRCERRIAMKTCFVNHNDLLWIDIAVDGDNGEPDQHTSKLAKGRIPSWWVNGCSIDYSIPKRSIGSNQIFLAATPQIPIDRMQNVTALLIRSFRVGPAPPDAILHACQKSYHDDRTAPTDCD